MTNEEAILLLKDQRDNDVFVLTDYRASIHEALTIAIQALEAQRWIPVTERLPEKQDCYLVTTKWKGSYSGDVYIETNMAVYREKNRKNGIVLTLLHGCHY